MSKSVALLKCGKVGCKLASSGACSDGHIPPESCQFYGKDPVTALDSDGADISINAEDKPDQPERIELSSGETFSTEQVDTFLRKKHANLISIVGDRDSGKTTLIASIYNLFLHGGLKEYIFAGSKTLIGFERRSHLARVDSGNNKADTGRTSRLEGLTYFHLSLAKRKTDNERFETLISDRAGEVYEEARDNSERVSELIELEKAHVVVFLLDGGRIANSFERASAMQATRQSLKAFLDGGSLNAKSIVQVVTTKVDLLSKHEDRSNINNQLLNFKNGIIKDIGPFLGKLIFADIAARPENHSEEVLGVSDLFNLWLSLPLPIQKTTPLPEEQIVSEFDKLILRTPMENIP